MTAGRARRGIGAARGAPPAAALLAGLLAGAAAAQPATELPPDAQEVLDPLLVGDIVDQCLPSVSFASAEMPSRPRRDEPEPRARLRRLVLAFDSSGSMAARTGGNGPSKMEAAQRAARDYLRSLPPDVEVGLVVFGHRGSARQDGRADSCAAADTEVVLGADGRAAALGAIDRLRPAGWTPLAAAMELAAAEFRPSEQAGEQVLVVISDGVETCGGDPVAVARRLSQGSLRVAVNIIGFDIAERERAALAAVADAGGGRFANVSGRDAAAEAARRAREATESAVAANRTQAAATVAINRNQAAATVAINRARSCVTVSTNREAAALTVAANRLTRDGRISQDTAAEARSLLNERHGKVREALAEYVAAVRGASGARVGEIRRQLEEALRR